MPLYRGSWSGNYASPCSYGLWVARNIIWLIVTDMIWTWQQRCHMLEYQPHTITFTQLVYTIIQQHHADYDKMMLLLMMMTKTMIIYGDQIKVMPYQNALFLANLESLKDRRIKLSQSFFKKILSTDSCLHTLLPPERNDEIFSKLCDPLKYPIPYSRTKKYQSFLNYALANFQNSM